MFPRVSQTLFSPIALISLFVDQGRNRLRRRRHVMPLPNPANDGEGITNYYLKGSFAELISPHDQPPRTKRTEAKI